MASITRPEDRGPRTGIGGAEAVGPELRDDSLDHVQVPPMCGKHRGGSSDVPDP